MSGLPAILANIKARARELGLSDADLAQRAGITPESLSRLGRRRTAHFDTIEKLAQVVGRRLIDAPEDDYVRALLHGGLMQETPSEAEPGNPPRRRSRVVRKHG